MFIPFLTQAEKPRPLFRRKGGGGSGGGGRGSSSSSGGGKSSGSSKGSSSGGITNSKSSGFSSTFGGKSQKASTYGQGGGTPSTIPAGYPFAGRSVGGGSRKDIFGTQSYGSGYPGQFGPRVAGQGFPFYFWPVVWVNYPDGSGSTHLHNSDYGSPDNTTRPGGPMSTASFQSSSTNTTFRILSDNSTVKDLINVVRSNCSSYLNFSGISPSPLPYTNNTPNPEEVVQYYRASSIALTLDGYNNTAIFREEGVANMPLPSGIDLALLDCVNQTVGLAAPLVNGAGVQRTIPNLSLMVLLYVLWNIISFI